MHYNDSKGKGCGKQFTDNKPKSSSKSSPLSERPKNNHAKKELEEMKKSINDMRHKMYEIANFKQGKSIIITNETVRVSQDLDVLITEYYRKNKI